MNRPDNENRDTGKHPLLWFVGLYCAGLLVTATAVYFLRFLFGLDW